MTEIKRFLMRIVLTLCFYCIIYPVWGLGRMIGWDPLKLKSQHDRQTYWED